MNTYKLSLCLLLIFLIGSCSTSETSTNNQLTENYSLEIVDSLQLDILAQSPSLVDVHSETGELLLIQPQPPKLWILSPEGEVKKVWEKSGDGPAEIGSALLSAEFIGDNISLMGRMVIKVFNRDFEVLDIFKPNYPPSGMGYLGFNHLIAFEGDGSNQLVSYLGGPQTEASYDSPEYYEEFNTVDVLNPSLQQTTFRPIGPLENDNRFKLSERSYFYIKPVFDVKNSQLIYGYNWDTTLYKRSLPSGDLISKEPIPFDEFYLNKGWTMGKAVEEMNSGNLTPRDRSGTVQRIFQANGFDLIFYNSGLPLERLNEITVSGRERFYELLRLDYLKYLILKEGVRLNKALRLPEKVSYVDMADDFGYVWAHKDISELKEEPDFITYYKLKVVPDEN